MYALTLLLNSWSVLVCRLFSGSKLLLRVCHYVHGTTRTSPCVRRVYAAGRCVCRRVYTPPSMYPMCVLAAGLQSIGMGLSQRANEAAQRQGTAHDSSGAEAAGTHVVTGQAGRPTSLGPTDFNRADRRLQ